MKRILSLDGGGIRGVFSLQILARIEDLFREEYSKPDLVLSDVCHMFAGASTGAIIAACLSWGMSVREIEQLYLAHGREMFARERWWRRLRAKYRAEAVAGFLRRRFSEDDAGAVPATLGSARLRTLLLVVMRNASTGSPWPVTNNPAALYNDSSRVDCNLTIPLWQLLRASTAAPTFFRPEEMTLGGETHMFVDGGITPFNNPALIGVLTATLPPYRVCWPATRDTLHVISVGTGTLWAKLPRKIAGKISILDQLRFLAPALIGSSAIEQDLICRVLGDCVHGAPLDSEIGALGEATLLPPEQQKFTYARYDQRLDVPARLDNVRLIAELQSAGSEYAQEHVCRAHLYPRQLT